MESRHERQVGNTAMYLRCYPYDSWKMSNHQDALSRLAEGLGLAEPTLFLDNGTPSSAPRAALESLLRHAEDGVFTVVLIPGLFVFSLDDAEARSVEDTFSRAGCQVVELPSPHALQKVS